MGKSKSSKKWLKEHFNDPFVKQAQKDGYRSRAVYKLLEIQQKHNFIKPGDHIIELGAAPGSWTEVLANMVGNQGSIYAVDLLEFAPVKNTKMIIGDFCSPQIQQQLQTHTNNKTISNIVSDMLPNATGIKKVDQLKSIALVEEVVYFAEQMLAAHGNLLVKILQGPGFDELMKQLRASYQKVSIQKPAASRSRSQEVYLLALNHKTAAN